MPCTTILVGKNASYDGSTMIARNDDSASGHFTPKKFVVVHPEEQPRTYRSVNYPMWRLDCRTIPCAIRQCRMPLKEKGSGQPAVSMRLMWP